MLKLFQLLEYLVDGFLGYILLRIGNFFADDLILGRLISRNEAVDQHALNFRPDSATMSDADVIRVVHDGSRSEERVEPLQQVTPRSNILDDVLEGIDQL